jgi:hypothetical protein
MFLGKLKVMYGDKSDVPEEEILYSIRKGRY